MAGKFTVTLMKSLTGRHDKHIATAHSLGLRKIGDSTVQPDNVQTQGKLSQIGYLVKIEEPYDEKSKKAAPKNQEVNE